MSGVEFPFRILKEDAGYVVMIRRRKWYGREYWTHYISARGLDNVPWHYRSYKSAYFGMMQEIKREVMDSIAKT